LKLLHEKESEEWINSHKYRITKNLNKIKEKIKKKKKKKKKKKNCYMRKRVKNGLIAINTELQKI